MWGYEECEWGLVWGRSLYSLWSPFSCWHGYFFFHSILFVLWLRFCYILSYRSLYLLTEHEVFTNPSHTARICKSFWSYKHKYAQCLPCVFPCSSVLHKLHLSNSLKGSLLNPCIQDCVLALSMKQHLHYQDWIHVYAKEQSAVTPHMAELFDDYKVIIICRSCVCQFLVPRW